MAFLCLCGQTTHQRHVGLGFALSRIGARQAELADEDRQHADRAGSVFAVGVALRTPALHDERSLGSGDLLGKFLNSGLGNARDGSRPRRRLLHHVVAGSHDVVAVGFILTLGRLRQRFLVVAHAVGVQEVEIHLVVHDPLMSDSTHQRGIGAGTNRQPLLRMSRRGLVQAIVDVDNAAAAALHRLANAREVPYDVSAAHTRFSRAVAKHYHQVACALGFGHRAGIDRVIGAKRRSGNAQRLVVAVVVQVVGTAVHVGHHALQHVRRIVVQRVQPATQDVQQAVGRIARHRVHTRTVGTVDGLVAIGVDGVLQLIGDGLDSLIPANGLEFSLAALSHSFHRLRQAIGMVQPATHRAAAQAGTRLEVGITRVVGFHVDDLPVAHVPLEHAATAAVHVALAPNDLILFFGMSNFHTLSEQRIGRHSRATGCCQRAQRAGRFHERASAQARHRVSHSLSPLLRLLVPHVSRLKRSLWFCA